MPKTAPKPSPKPVVHKRGPETSNAKVTSKAKPKPTSVLAARPAHIDLTVDRALKQSWERAEAVVRASKQKGAVAFDELWETVAEVVEHEPPLYLAGGFSSTRAFLTAYLGETERSAYRNMRVAKYASPAEEARYGVAKLDLVLGYVEAKLGAPAKGRLPVDFAKVKIPVKRDGKERTVGIEEATAQDIAAATRSLARAAKKPRTNVSPVVTTLTRALAKGPLRGVTVRLSNGKLSLGGIEPSALPALLKALSGLKLPES